MKWLSSKKSKIYIAILLFGLYPLSYVFTLTSDPYREAKRFILVNQTLTQEIGVIEGCRLSLFGYSWEYSGSSGSGSFKFIVSGKHSNGTVYVEMIKSAGVWHVREANLILKSKESEQMIDLLSTQQETSTMMKSVRQTEVHSSVQAMQNSSN